EYFRPLETFGERLEEVLLDVVGLGFRAIDLWGAHLNGSWATDEHIATAQELLDRHSLPVVSLAGGFGGTLEELEGFCRIAAGLESPLLGGRTDLVERERGAVLELLRRHGLKLGIENHPEATPAEVAAQIAGDADSSARSSTPAGGPPWATTPSGR